MVYIHLHLVDFYGKCRYVRFPYMDPMGLKKGPFYTGKVVSRLSLFQGEAVSFFGGVMVSR